MSKINCPNCNNELEESKVLERIKEKGSFKCPECKSVLEIGTETEENEMSTAQETKTEKTTDELPKGNTTASAKTKTAKEKVEKTTEEKPKKETKAKVEKTTEEKPKKEAKAKVEKVELDHEALVTFVREKMSEDKTIGERVHGTYVSFYKNENNTKRGDRFLVVYRNGRNIKAQFFGIEFLENANVRKLEQEDAFEYKGKDPEDFKKYIESVF